MCPLQARSSAWNALWSACLRTMCFDAYIGVLGERSECNVRGTPARSVGESWLVHSGKLHYHKCIKMQTRLIRVMFIHGDGFAVQMPFSALQLFLEKDCPLTSLSSAQASSRRLLLPTPSPVFLTPREADECLFYSFTSDRRISACCPAARRLSRGGNANTWFRPRMFTFTGLSSKGIFHTASCTQVDFLENNKAVDSRAIQTVWWLRFQ